MKKLYSVYDCVNCEFAQPFMLNNDNSAVDMFVKDLKNIAKQNLAKFSDLDIDRYQLYMLCDFDIESGKICSAAGECDSISPELIYDVKNCFDFSEFEAQLQENDKSRGLELKGGN